jgi:RimJ/RimL family protein N-acetyltransferase
MTKFNPQIVTLKNQKQVVIRQAEAKDAEELLHCLKTYISQSQFIPKHDYEINLTVEQEVDWINSYLKNENSILLVAEYKTQLIGNIDVTGSQRERMKHTGMIGMGMLEEWRNSGLGTHLMENAVAWATQNSILELLWLQVYTANHSALHLYKKIGFVDNGTIQNYFKNETDYFDVMTMSLEVKNK